MWSGLCRCTANFSRHTAKQNRLSVLSGGRFTCKHPIAAISQHRPNETAVPVPLCKREPKHVQGLDSVLGWQKHTLSRIIKTIGSSFNDADEGPDVPELKREVTWVLDDAVAAYRTGPRDAWVPCTWQQLQLELNTAKHRGLPTPPWEVLLRASADELHALWQQRLQDRVPFQYLINTAHWCSYILSVGPGILIPRPETEAMVDLAANAVAANANLAAAPWADLGTGSGAIAIGVADMLAQHNQAARVWAVDLSPTAVAYATYNAQQCGVPSVVYAVCGSWYEPLQHQQGSLGGIVSNPPYIPHQEMPGLQAEVGRHEPWSALDGGDGPGMDSLQVICTGAVEMLQPGGFLALETAGQHQAGLVKQLLEGMHAQPNRLDLGTQLFENVVIHDDCYDVPRFVTATRTKC
eukprot:jgi/Chrzof1/13083/Cz07g19060.t1